MDAAAELGRNPVSKHQIQPEYGDEQADAGRDCRTCLARPILRRERGQGNIHFPCSADHEQDWQPYPVDPYPWYMCDHTYILSMSPYHHTNTNTVILSNNDIRCIERTKGIICGPSEVFTKPFKASIKPFKSGSDGHRIGITGVEPPSPCPVEHRRTKRRQNPSKYRSILFPAANIPAPLPTKHRRLR